MCAFHQEISSFPLSLSTVVLSTLYCPCGLFNFLCTLMTHSNHSVLYLSFFCNIKVLHSSYTVTTQWFNLIKCNYLLLLLQDTALPDIPNPQLQQSAQMILSKQFDLKIRKFTYVSWNALNWINSDRTFLIKSRRLWWAGHVARIEEGRSAFKILIDKETFREA